MNRQRSSDKKYLTESLHVDLSTLYSSTRGLEAEASEVCKGLNGKLTDKTIEREFNVMVISNLFFCLDRFC